MTEENPRVKKDTTVLLNERYRTPNTSMLIFHFEPYLYASTESKLADSSIKHIAINSKDVYVIDNFLSDEESEALRSYSKNATFSRHSYASSESREKGEDPAKSMNNKEKWELFAKPPEAVREVYKFLSTLAQRMNADITTLPWDLCDEKICASALATNYIQKVSKESMDMGTHGDYDTEEGISFGIPILYEQPPALHPTSFKNGDVGKPWLVTLMLYATDENFLPKYGMGTIFCEENGKVVSKADCKQGRIVFFEGDVPHSIEESKLPPDVSTWRVSYVLKLVINPRNKNQSMKAAFSNLIRTVWGHQIGDEAK